MRTPHCVSGAARRCRRAALLFVLAAALIPVAPVQAAPKTDIIVFLNGDRLTGEIKGLEKGRLELSTDTPAR